MQSLEADLVAYGLEVYTYWNFNVLGLVLYSILPL